MFYFDKDLANGYESFWNVPSLPKFNWASDELRARMLEVVQRWLLRPYHQDGGRIDVASSTGRRGADDYAAEVAVAIRRAMADTGRDLLLIAEHSQDATVDLSGAGWHGTMNYAGFTYPIWCWLRDPEVDIPALGIPGPVPRLPGPTAFATMRSFAAVMPWVSLTHSWNLLGSHDTARIRSVVTTSALVEVAAGLMLTLPGIPMIFAGDEIGLTGTWGEDARTPMPWKHRDRWDLDTLRRYQELITLRLTHPALQTGGHRWVRLDDEAIVFLRERPPRAAADSRGPSQRHAHPAAVPRPGTDHRGGHEPLRRCRGPAAHPDRRCHARRWPDLPGVAPALNVLE